MEFHYFREFPVGKWLMITSSVQLHIQNFTPSFVFTASFSTVVIKWKYTTSRQFSLKLYIYVCIYMIKFCNYTQKCYLIEGWKQVKKCFTNKLGLIFTIKVRYKELNLVANVSLMHNLLLLFSILFVFHSPIIFILISADGLVQVLPNWMCGCLLS